MVESWDSLSREALTKFLNSFFLNIASHAHLWFQEVERHLGLEAACSIQERVWRRLLPILERRIPKNLVLDPNYISRLKRKDLYDILRQTAKLWLAVDGVWFQEVEGEEGIYTAKSCNDLAWRRFTRIEAKRIMENLNIPKGGGLKALKKALSFRMYTWINSQKLVEEDNFLELYMLECRVQETRKRKGLPDYPCKSGGIVEYSYFAKEVDPSIKTVCIGCPPDPHPDEWWCAWRFEI